MGRRMGKKGRVRAAALLACLALYAALLVADGLWPRAGKADMAVVLGNKVLADGQASPCLAARLNEALLAYRAGLAPKILVSGGRETNGFDEADVMSAYLQAHGVPADAVFKDHQGYTTWATAVHTQALMRAQNLQSALVISQYFHLPRCEFAFHRAGIGTVFAAYPDYATIWDVYAVAREMLALPVYALLHRAGPRAAVGRPLS